ncbi:30S ribosomal protein S6 [Candidatus Parcubacteria bacterium]|nr:MAG: 30S ribosomal protein S6 [Candidatus Parcubacteria bacterium]
MEAVLHQDEKEHIQEDERVRSYELAYVVRSENGVSRILQIMKEQEGEIEFEGACNPLELAYPIKKIKKAYFGYFHLKLPSDKVENLAKALRMEEEVLRFLLITPPIVKREPRPRQGAGLRGREQSARAQAREGGKETAAKKPEKLPLSNEDLEKKIEEILQ